MFLNFCVSARNRIRNIKAASLLVLLFGWVTSTVYGQGSVECGIDCLFLAARFYGVDVELRQIRNAAGPAADNGYPLSQLRDVARQFGLFSQIYHGEPASLNWIRSPCVVMLHMKSNHFVLMQDFDLEANLVQVFDPTNERFDTVSLNDWSGYALLLAKEEVVIEVPTSSSKWWQWMILALISIACFLLAIFGFLKWRER